VSVVRIIESPYYRGYFYTECMGIFPGPSELSVLDKFDCMYIKKNWSMLLALHISSYRSTLEERSRS